MRTYVIGATGGAGTTSVALALAILKDGWANVWSHDPTSLCAHAGISTVEQGDMTTIQGQRINIGSLDPDFVDVGTIQSWAARKSAGYFHSLNNYREGDRIIVVVRGPSYIACRELVKWDEAPDGSKPVIVLAKEEGRALTRDDLNGVSPFPVVAEFDITTTTARALDSGLFLTRVRCDGALAGETTARPRSMSRALSGLANNKEALV